MFGTRLLSGAVLLVLTAVFLYFGGIPLFVILALISVVGFRELMNVLHEQEQDKRHSLTEWIGIIGIFALYGYQILCFCVGQAVDIVCLMSVMVFTVILLLAAYVITYPKFQAVQIAKTVFAFMYVPVMLSFIGLTRALPEIGVKAVWLIWISAWGSDTCAYCVGMLTAKTCGNHKAFPKLSPKKSWEGCVGGVVGTVLIGILFGKYVMGTEYSAVLIGVICGLGSVISQCGDLAASAIKRDYNIKDYGKCIPGHGGILDRFDSIIFTAPCIYFLIYLFLNL